MAGPLQGQAALVTGASSGIGAATALALADAGASVALVARRAERLHALVGQIEAGGGEALALPGDVSEEAVAKQVVSEAVHQFGRLDILINSAGTIQMDNLEDADLAQWRRVIDTNLMASIYTCHAVLATMKEQGSGTIINVGSLACRTTSPIFNAYATSKSALNAMTDGLRQEVGSLGIRVGLVAPGTVSTEIAEGIVDAPSRQAIREHLSQEGALQAEDMAATILFMVSAPRHVNISEMWVRATTDVLY